MDNNPCSLQACLESILTEAAEAHSQCCHSDAKWAPFYAAFVAKRLTPVLCAIQAYASEVIDKRLAERLAPFVTSAMATSKEPLPVIASVHKVLTPDSFDGGPTWFLR